MRDIPIGSKEGVAKSCNTFFVVYLGHIRSSSRLKIVKKQTKYSKKAYWLPL